MVTQKDISAACGVSIAAVSRALGDHSDISEGTKKRIREMADKMGYREDREAREKRHTYMIGLLVTEEAETRFHQEIMMEIGKCLRERGYDLVLLSPVDKEKMEAKRPGYLSRARLLELEGVFIFSRVQEKELYHQQELRDLRELLLGEIPVIAVDCGFGSCSSILPEYEQGIHKLVGDACERGHRRIAFVYRDDSGAGVVCERAFHIAMKRHRLKVPGKFLRCVQKEGVREAYEETVCLLQSGRWIRPTCILFADDVLLEGGAEAILHCGVRVPEEISLAAMRFSSRSRFPGLQVTSWWLSPAHVAQEAVEQMLQSLHTTGMVHGYTHRISGIVLSGENPELRGDSALPAPEALPGPEESSVPAKTGKT